MRLLILTAIFMVFGWNTAFALQPPQTANDYWKNRYQYLQETLQEGQTPYKFFSYFSKVKFPSFYEYERFFRRQAIHNPFVWRQGVGAPGVPGAGFSSLPFDIHTPAGTIPGCLNILCPAPAAALWYAGVCYCG